MALLLKPIDQRAKAFGVVQQIGPDQQRLVGHELAIDKAAQVLGGKLDFLVKITGRYKVVQPCRAGFHRSDDNIQSGHG